MNRKQAPVNPSLQVKFQRDCNTVLFNIFLYHGSTTAHNTTRGDYSAGSYLDLCAPKFDFALNILLRLKGQCTYKIQIRISSYTIVHFY